MISYLTKANDIAYKYAMYLKAGFYGDSNRCFEIAKRGYKKDILIQYCLNKYLYLEKTFVELRLNASETILKETNFPVLGCKCCGVGTFPAGNNLNEINELIEFEQIQRKKYQGQYVCKYCEQKKDNFSQYAQNYFLIENGFGENGMIISPEGVKDPQSSFLGFAGRWFLIKKNNGELIITNNLWDKGSLPSVFKNEWLKHINCYAKEFYGIKQLKELLSTEEFFKIKDQNDFKLFCKYTKTENYL